MSRKTCNALTKADLENYGFVNIFQDKQGKWHFERFWYGCGKRNNVSKMPEKKLCEIKATEAVCKHKYTAPKVYLKLTFAYNNKTITLPLARIIYAWFHGEVPAGLDCEHIDNNPFNNNLDNLRLTTRSENLAKKWADNPAN